MAVTASRVAEGALAIVAISMQPTAVDCRVCYSESGDRTMTAIYRAWPAGTTGSGGACHRCRDCKARDDGCLMLVPWRVPREAARDFSPIDSGVPVRPT